MTSVSRVRTSAVAPRRNARAQQAPLTAPLEDPQATHTHRYISPKAVSVEIGHASRLIFLREHGSTRCGFISNKQPLMCLTSRGLPQVRSERSTRHFSGRGANHRILNFARGGSSSTAGQSRGLTHALGHQAWSNVGDHGVVELQESKPSSNKAAVEVSEAQRSSRTPVLEDRPGYTC